MKSIYRNLLITLVLILGSTILMPVTTFASPYNNLCNNGQITDGSNGVNNNALCSDTPTSNPVLGANGIIAKVTNIVTIIAGIAAVIMIVISGLQFVLANGDANRVATARNTIIFSVVGLIVIVLARFIIEFVVGKIT